MPPVHIIELNLHFKPEFTSRTYKNVQQKIKLPSVRVEPTTLTIIGLEV